MSGITFIRYYRFRNIEKNSYRHFSRKPKEKPTLSLNFTFHYIRCLFNKSFHRYGPLFHTKQQAILIPVFTLKTNTQICVYNGYYMQPIYMIFGQRYIISKCGTKSLKKSDHRYSKHQNFN